MTMNQPSAEFLRKLTNDALYESMLRQNEENRKHAEQLERMSQAWLESLKKLWATWAEEAARKGQTFIVHGYDALTYSVKTETEKYFKHHGINATWEFSCGHIPEITGVSPVQSWVKLTWF